MRVLWETFTVLMGIVVILAIAKGFPGFGRVLAALFLNPLGLLAVIGLAVWIIVLRNKALARRAARQPTGDL